VTVKLDADALDSAMSALEDLASAIDFHRNWCIKDSPVELASLAEGTQLTRVRDWMTDQVAEPLGVVRDLARLLDTEGGTVEFEGSGDIDDLRAKLGTELAEHMADFGDLDSPEDIEDFQNLMVILDRYKDDIVVSGAFHTELGPEGLAQLMDKARTLTDPNGQYQNYLLNNLSGDSTPSYPEASELAVQFQDGIAALMADSLATGSLWKDFPDSYATDLADYGDGSTAAIIFDYAGRHGDVFARDFLNDAGNALLEREDGLGGMYWSGMGIPTQFGTADMDSMQDPVLQWMEALRHNGAASQDQLLDPERAEYLLDDRFYLYEDVEGGAAGDVLAAATVDEALNSGTMGENAAKISSWALNHFGGEADPRDGLKEELGGIVATYIRDVSRVALDPDSADTPGIYGPGDLPAGLFEGDGFPPYGITLDRGALNNLLDDIGDNDSAVSIIGDSAGRFTQARLDQAIETTVRDGHLKGTEIGLDDPFYNATYTNSAITGFLYDGLYDGSIADAKEDDAAQERMWKLLMVPTEYVKVPGGPVGSYVVGEVKDLVKKEFVGGGASEAVTDAEDGYNTVRNFTLLQSLHTLVTSDAAADFPAGDLRDDWPTDDYGNPKNPNEMSAPERTSIIASITGTGETTGYGAAANTAARSGMDTLQEQYK
jgi:hypothetical protein